MGVVWTRTGTPFPGHQAEAFEFAKKRAAAVNAAYGTQVEVHVRFGGPLGQIVMISRHKNVQEIEDIKRKVIEDSASGKIPSSNGNIFASVDDAIWLTK
jgi:hypothetical protein